MEEKNKNLGYKLGKWVACACVVVGAGCLLSLISALTIYAIRLLLF